MLEPLTDDDPTHIGRFLIRARLGAGGMGRVYLASTEGGRPVAVKVMRSEVGLNPEFRERFRQEVEAARRVHGFYTAQVIDADPDAAQPWLATVYVPAPSLHQVVREHGTLPEASVLLLMAGIGEALQAIHAAGIVHRDLKPSNVLLATDGPRVIDFGIARIAESTSLTRYGVVVGSPGYMSPEQALGASAGPAADVFSLGSLAAFAAQGRGPFGDDGSISVLHRVAHQAPVLDGCPPRVLAIVKRCLEKDPARRPTPSDIIDYCRRATGGHSSQAGQSWLPGPVAAAVTQKAATSLPPPAPVAPRAPVAPAPTPRPWTQQPVATGLAGYVPVPPGASPRIGRKTLVGAAVAGFALAAVAGAIIYTAENGNSTNTAGSGSSGTKSASAPATSSAASTEPASQPSPTQIPTPTTPPAPWYSGTWLGTVSQPTGTVTEWTVILTLPADGGAGTFDSPSLGCSGSLVVTSATSVSVSMKDDLTSDPQQICVNAVMSLIDDGAGHASYTWQDVTHAQNVGTAQLTQG